MLAEAEDYNRGKLPDVESTAGIRYRSTEMGLCLIMLIVLGIKMPFTNFKRNFPELYAKRTNARGERTVLYFWKNWEERKEALRQCVEETA
jgi:hypothetical protein